jgi:hypothetical protein
VEGEKLSPTATHAQGSQDYTRVNVSRNTTPSRNISNENSSWGEGNIVKNVKVLILFVFIQLLLK